MAYDSFRDFLFQLEESGELKRLSQPLATELEITEVADREMKKPGGGLALLIEKPTVKGQPSPFPLAINTLGSNKRMAMSLGVGSVEEVATELGIATKTSDTHRTNIMHKLDLHAFSELVRYAVRQKIVDA